MLARCMGAERTFARQGVRQSTVEAVVIRADGTRESLGVIAFWHRNPLRRWAWRMGQWLRGRRAGSVSISNNRS